MKIIFLADNNDPYYEDRLDCTIEVRELEELGLEQWKEVWDIFSGLLDKNKALKNWFDLKRKQLTLLTREEFKKEVGNCVLKDEFFFLAPHGRLESVESLLSNNAGDYYLSLFVEGEGKVYAVTDLPDFVKKKVRDYKKRMEEKNKEVEEKRRAREIKKARKLLASLEDNKNKV